jgi:hypothetical protein
MLALLAAAAASAAQPANGQIADIRMHLFYRHTGALSDDISPPREFAGWNTVIGEGDSGGPADDLVVVVAVRAAGEEYIERPLRLTARGRNNRVIAQRSFDSLLTSSDGQSYSPLWLQNVGCEGDIRVTATFGDHTRTESVSLDCGE